MPEQGHPAHTVEGSMHDPRVTDPRQELVNRADLDEASLDQIVRVMDAMRDWRQAESRMSEASRKYMKLGETDMRALRFLISAHNQSVLATPGAISDHLGISSASTTKLLDRLERGGHITRSPHPTDHETRVAARETVGRQHARRFYAAARLTSEEREVVIRFLSDLSATETTPANGSAPA
jgi:DNA-binding MarR family transcriptional regulator